MFKKILESSINFISHNNKFIRLGFITSFFHSLTVIYLIVYNFNNILHYRFNSGVDFIEVVTEVVAYMKGERSIALIVLFLGIIGYELLFPVGQAAMIRYLENDDKKLSRAIGQGLEKFFPMFEFINLATLFGSVTVLTTFLRIITLDILGNPIIIILMSIWMICALVTGIMRPYVKYAISLENMNLSEAMKYSGKLAMQNLSITLKFIILEGFLLVRFLLNLIVILGIPLLILYIASLFNVLGVVTNKIVIITGLALVVVCAYLNAIIEAFFTTYRYKLYKYITTKEEPL